MQQQSSSAKHYEFRAEMKQLLGIIIHSLYTHKEVFLRELISNASDALNKARFLKATGKDILDPDTELKISIDVDPKTNMFSIEDTGIGMTQDELVNNLGTIARSGTLEFLKQAASGKQPVQGELVGRFGVGFYSVFMVADEVSVETRHAEAGSRSYLWKSTGEGEFTIEEGKRQERGTRIFFHLKEDAGEYSQPFAVREIINKYSNFADFPIYIKDDRVNRVTALWQKKAEEIKTEELEEFYKFLTDDYNPPLGHLQLSLEGTVNFKALLFVPQEAPPDFLRFQNEKALHLYSSRILIQDNCKELLPEYLRFLKGVVDTPDLPLNVSREVTQASPVTAKIREILTSRVLTMLEGWLSGEREKYNKFYGQFSPYVKMGASQDTQNRKKISELLMFETSQHPCGQTITLAEYVNAMPKEQGQIYYLSGDSRVSMERNPNLEYFNKNKIEVLLLSDPIDVFVLPALEEYSGKKIVSIEKADIELKAADRLEKPSDKLTESLLTLFKETLHDKLGDVVASKRLVDSAVTLVSAKDAPDQQMEKMLKLMKSDYQKAKKIMEVNTEHPLIRNLSRIYLADTKNPILRKCIVQLYEAALLVESNPPVSPDFIKRMTEIMEEATRGG